MFVSFTFRRTIGRSSLTALQRRSPLRIRSEDSDSGESFSADTFDSSQEEMTEEMMETLMDPLTKVNTWEKTRLGRLIFFFYASRQTHKP